MTIVAAAAYDTIDVFYLVCYHRQCSSTAMIGEVMIFNDKYVCSVIKKKKHQINNTHHLETTATTIQ